MKFVLAAVLLATGASAFGDDSCYRSEADPLVSLCFPMFLVDISGRGTMNIEGRGPTNFFKWVKTSHGDISLTENDNMDVENGCSSVVTLNAQGDLFLRNESAKCNIKSGKFTEIK